MVLYRSKPSMIEAVHWTGENVGECETFAPNKVYKPPAGELQLLAGKDGVQEWVPVPVGHWLVCQPDDKTDVWPVDSAYFAAKYEPA